NIGIPTPEIQKRVDNALKLVEMHDFQDHSPHKLSGGQKQRVAIAGIIAMEPSCIILDEPTAMLDPGGRKEVMDTIEYLNKEKNITIIHITHFMEEAVQSEKVLVMNQGEIVKQADPYKIFKDDQFLKNINLDVPVIVELASTLRKENIDIPEVLFMDELVDAIC
ncbi:MAG: ATP-binding cassette domain-containing protein, partial [Halanaerobiales bacterium]